MWTFAENMTDRTVQHILMIAAQKETTALAQTMDTIGARPIIQDATEGTT
jgi:hypothetical protein